DLHDFEEFILAASEDVSVELTIEAVGKTCRSRELPEGGCRIIDALWFIGRPRALCMVRVPERVTGGQSRVVLTPDPTTPPRRGCIYHRPTVQLAFDLAKKGEKFI